MIDSKDSNNKNNDSDVMDVMDVFDVEEGEPDEVNLDDGYAEPSAEKRAENWTAICQRLKESKQDQADIRDGFIARGETPPEFSIPEVITAEPMLRMYEEHEAENQVKSENNTDEAECFADNIPDDPESYCIGIDEVPAPEASEEVKARIKAKIQERDDEKNDRDNILMPYERVARPLINPITVSKEDYPEVRDELFHQLAYDSIDEEAIYTDTYFINQFGQIYNGETGHFFASIQNHKAGSKRGNQVLLIKLSLPCPDSGGKSRKTVTFYVHQLVAHTYWVRPSGFDDCDHIDETLKDTTNNMLNCEPYNLQWLMHRDHERKTYIDILIEIPGFGSLLPIQIYESIWEFEADKNKSHFPHYHEFHGFIGRNGNDANAISSYCDKHFEKSKIPEIHERFANFIKPQKPPKLRDENSLGTPQDFSELDDVENGDGLFYQLRLPDGNLSETYLINKASQLYTKIYNRILAVNLRPDKKGTYYNLWGDDDFSSSIHVLMASTFYEEFNRDVFKSRHIKMPSELGYSDNRIENIEVVYKAVIPKSWRINGE